MRNQTWNTRGELLGDIEITRVSGVIVAIDYLASTTRPATAEERELLYAQERTQRIADTEATVIDLLAQGKDTWKQRDVSDLVEALSILVLEMRGLQ
ncbi:MAG: hypothetical protein ACOC58_00015 [Chloroflexota bacterium]